MTKYIPFPVRPIAIPRTEDACTWHLDALLADRDELVAARDSLPLVEVEYRTQVLADIARIDRESENTARLRTAIRFQQLGAKEARVA